MSSDFPPHDCHQGTFDLCGIGGTCNRTTQQCECFEGFKPDLFVTHNRNCGLPYLVVYPIWLMMVISFSLVQMYWVIKSFNTTRSKVRELAIGLFVAIISGMIAPICLVVQQGAYTSTIVFFIFFYSSANIVTFKMSVIFMTGIKPLNFKKKMKIRFVHVFNTSIIFGIGIAMIVYLNLAHPPDYDVNFLRSYNTIASIIGIALAWVGCSAGFTLIYYTEKLLQEIHKTHLGLDRVKTSVLNRVRFGRFAGIFTILSGLILSLPNPIMYFMFGTVPYQWMFVILGDLATRFFLTTIALFIYQNERARVVSNLPVEEEKDTMGVHHDMTSGIPMKNVNHFHDSNKNNNYHHEHNNIENNNNNNNNDSFTGIHEEEKKEEESINLSHHHHHHHHQLHSKEMTVI